MTISATGATAMSSVRVELVVGQPGQCPVAAASSSCETTVNNVSRCCDCAGDGSVAEFTVPGGDHPEEADLEAVFTSESRTRYRDTDVDCDECVVSLPAAFDCPVTDVFAEHGDLHLVFHAPSVERVREIVARARDSFDEVAVSRLTPSGDRDGPDPVVVDAGQLTERQREVLATAHEMGYFEHPKAANAGDVAAALDISPSTFAEHLAAAQQKLVGSLFSGQSP